MENFEILNTEQLQAVKGGHNEMTHADRVEEGIV